MDLIQTELSRLQERVNGIALSVSALAKNLERLLQETEELAKPETKQKRENPKEFMKEAVRCLTAHERTALSNIKKSESTQAVLHENTDKHKFMRGFLETMLKKFVETDLLLTRKQIRSLHQVFWSLGVRDVPLTDEERDWVWSK